MPKIGSGKANDGSIVTPIAIALAFVRRAIADHARSVLLDVVAQALRRSRDT